MTEKVGLLLYPLIHVFGFDIEVYLVFIGAGIVAVTVFNAFRRKKLNLKVWELILLLALTLALMLAFCRLFYALLMIPVKGASWETFWHDLLHGGMVFYGGMFGIIAGCLLFALVRRRKAREVLDFFAPSIALSLVFARLGCLFNGCCYGIECAFGVPNQKFPGQLLLPVQLFESAVNLVIFIAFLLRERVKKTNRFHLEAYFVVYGVARFILEFFRGNSDRMYYPDRLSGSQHISILIVLFVLIEAAVLTVRKSKKSNQKRPDDPAERKSYET